MKTTAYFIVYPEGDEQEVPHRLPINQMVDINGFPLPLPLPTAKMIAYRVYKTSTRESRNEIGTYFYLEQLTADELRQFV